LLKISRIIKTIIKTATTTIIVICSHLGTGSFTARKVFCPFPSESRSITETSRR